VRAAKSVRRTAGPATAAGGAGGEEHLAAFLALAAERYVAPLLKHVVRALHEYLRCGLLEHGFLRVRCDACRQDRLARLAALIPAPRHPFLRYHGVLAAASKWRKEIVPRLVEATSAGSAAECAHGMRSTESRTWSRYVVRWKPTASCQAVPKASAMRRNWGTTP
jgi:hypothetical protein